MENKEKQESANNIYLTDWSALHEAGDFSQQAEVFLRTVRMTRATVKQFDTLLHDLRLQLLKIWPDFKFTILGSSASGLALRSSDIDVFITFPETTTTTTVETERMLVKLAAETLGQNGTFTDVNTVCVPGQSILRLSHKPTKLKCDVMFRYNANDKDAQCVRYLISLDSRILPLMIIVKYWSNLYSLVTNDDLPNIFWTLLVIFYLQQVDILPSIHSLQKSAEPKIINHWNYSIEESFEYLYLSKNNDSLYKLLGGFFNYYANFDFANNVISVFAGTAVPCDLFSNIDKLTDIFEQYKSNVRNNLVTPLDTGRPIRLQNLFRLNRCYPVTNRNFEVILIHFKKAQETFRKIDKKYFLQTIMAK